MAYIEFADYIRTPPYLVNYVFIDHQVPFATNRTDVTAALAWCEEVFGPGLNLRTLIRDRASAVDPTAEIQAARWGFWPSGSLFFRDVNDALAFKMRWC